MPEVVRQHNLDERIRWVTEMRPAGALLRTPASCPWGALEARNTSPPRPAWDDVTSRVRGVHMYATPRRRSTARAVREHRASMRCLRASLSTTSSSLAAAPWNSRAAAGRPARDRDDTDGGRSHAPCNRSIGVVACPPPPHRDSVVDVGGHGRRRGYRRRSRSSGAVGSRQPRTRGGPHLRSVLLGAVSAHSATGGVRIQASDDRAQTLH